MIKTLNRRAVLAGMSGLALASQTQILTAGSKPGHIVIQGGSPAINTGYTHLVAAQQLGFFEEEGLTIDLRFSRGAPLAAQIVNSGDADIGNFTYEPLILGYSKGLRGKYVYQFYNKTIYFIGVPADGEIENVTDLRGKKIGVASLSSSALPIARAILREQGVDPSEVTFLPVGVGGSVIAALENGEVDAIAQWDAAYGILERLGAKFRYFRHPELAQIGNGGFLASEDLLTNRSDEIARYGRAVAKGSAFFFANPDAAIQLYWKANPNGRGDKPLDQALADARAETKYLLQDIAVEPGDDGKTLFGNIELASVQRYIDILSAEIDIPNTPSADMIADPSFVGAFNDFDHEAIKKMAIEYQVD